MPDLTADSVLNARFQPTSFREGYDQDEVDSLLDAVVQLLKTHEEGGLIDAAAAADLCTNVRFQPTKFREGYDQDQVDDLLAALARGFRELAAAGPSAAPGRLAPPAAGRAVPGPVPGTTAGAARPVGRTATTGTTSTTGPTSTTSTTPGLVESTRPSLLTAILLGVGVLAVVVLVVGLLL